MKVPEYFKPKTFKEEMAEGKSLEDGLSGSKKMQPDPHKVLHKVVRTTRHSDEDKSNVEY